MSFVNPNTPNLADFVTFCQGQGVAAAFLPANSDYYTWAFNYALDRTIYVCPIPGIEYSLACYNLGLHWLITQAPDQTGLGLTSLTYSGGLVTATTTAALGLPVGAQFNVVILGCAPIGYNGAYSAVALSTNIFSYEQSTNPGASPATSVGVFNLAFFSGLRAQWNLLSLVAGPVQTTGDQGTNTTLVVPDFFKELTLDQLDLIKTPWGRAYLSYTQKSGPTVIGVS